MADTLLPFEHIERRMVEDRTSIRLFHRVYRVPPEAGLIPVRGAAVDLDGVTGEDILQPRVFSNPAMFPGKTGAMELRITFYQIRQYA